MKKYVDLSYEETLRVIKENKYTNEELKFSLSKQKIIYEDDGLTDNLEKIVFRK